MSKPVGAPARGERASRRAHRSRAARVLPGEPAQSVGQEPVDQLVHARELAARAIRRSTRPIRPTRAATASTSTASSARSGSRGRSIGRAKCSSPGLSNRRFDRASTSGAAAVARSTRVVSARPLTVSGRYTFDYTRLFDEQIAPEDRLLIDRLFPQVRLSTFTGSMLRDSRNDVLDPERGTVTGVDGSVAPRFAGSEVGFAKSFLQGAVYRRLPGASRFTLAASAGSASPSASSGFVARVDDTGGPVLRTRRAADRRGRQRSAGERAVLRAAATRPCAASCSIGWARRTP